MTKCKSCGATIEFFVTEKGRKIPVEMPGEKRVVLLDGVAHIMTTFTPHHATCPDAEKWKKATYTPTNKKPQGEQEEVKDEGKRN